MQRAMNLKTALKLGVHLTLDDIDADELYAMLIIGEERDKFDEEKAGKS